MDDIFQCGDFVEIAPSKKRISSDVSFKQMKYLDANNIDEKAQLSDDSFLDVLKEIRKRDGVFCEVHADKRPLKDGSGKIIRGVDFEGADTKRGTRFYGEFKDFSRMACYNATGLPVPYIEKLYSLGSVPYIFFIDNFDFVKKRALTNLYRDAGKTEEDVINELIRYGCATREMNGDIKFVPYGEYMDFLMKPENRRIDLENKPILCDWQGRYHGCRQFIFRNSAMSHYKKVVYNMFGR